MADKCEKLYLTDLGDVSKNPPKNKYVKIYRDEIEGVGPVKKPRTKKTTLSQRVDSIGKRVDSLSQTVDSLSQTVDSLSQTVDSLSQTVDSLSQTVDSLSKRINQLADIVQNGFKQVNTRLDYIVKANNLKDLPNSK